VIGQAAGLTHQGLAAPGSRASRAPHYACRVVTDQRECVLVTAGCTTGWTDWIHGELWLCPDGLLRKSLGFAATVKHAMFPTVNPNSRPVAGFSATDIERIVSGRGRNLWIAWGDIEQAVLRPVRLDLLIRGGRKVTLMWVPVDDVAPLRDRLPGVLGARLQLT
jgi:hypothetical protein